MLKLKKSILSITLFFLVVTTAAHAFVPLAYIAAVVGPELAPYVTASAVIHGVAAVAGLYYYLRQGSQTKANDNGILTPSQVQWISLQDPPQVKTKDLNAFTSYEAMQALVAQTSPDGSYKYPLLRTALTKPDAPDVRTQTGRNTDGTQFGNLTPGSKFIDSNGKVRIVVKVVHVSDIFSPTAPYIYDDTSYPPANKCQVVTYGQIEPIWASDVARIHFQDSVETTANLVPRTKPEAKASLQLGGTDGNVNPAYQDEINRMHQDPLYEPTFTDDTTGLPHSPPPLGDIATPAEVAAYNRNGQLQDTRDAAQAAREAAIAAAQTAANNAQAAAAAAAAQSAANPGDAQLAAAAAAAQAAADAANAALQKLLSDIADRELDDVEKDSDEAAEVPTAPTRKTIDTTALHGLKGALDSTYPFNLPSVIGGYFDRFVSSPEAPVFDLPLPLDQTLHVDLSVLEPIAILLRYLIGIVVTVGMLFYIVHFIRGVS